MGPVRVDSVDCHLGGSRLRLAILASRMLRSTSAAYRPHRIRARTHAGRGVRACVQASEDSEPRGRCDARRVTAHCARTKTTPERARRRLRPTSSCPLAAPTERSDVAHSHGTLPRLPFNPQIKFPNLDGAMNIFFFARNRCTRVQVRGCCLKQILGVY